MERYTELSEDTIEVFNKTFDSFKFPLGIKMQFIGDLKQKNLIKISKIPNDYSFIMNKELKVSINEEMMDAFDDESIIILFEQEINRIEVNLDNGKLKLTKPDFNTYTAILNKHGVEKVQRALQVAELYQEQKDDSMEDNFIMDNNKKTII